MIAAGVIGAVCAFVPWYQEHQWRVVNHLENGVQAGVLTFLPVQNRLGIFYAPWGPVFLVLAVVLVVTSLRLPIARRAFGWSALVIGVLGAVAVAIAMVRMGQSLQSAYHYNDCQVECPGAAGGQPGEAWVFGVYAAGAVAVAAIWLGVLQLRLVWNRGGHGFESTAPSIRTGLSELRHDPRTPFALASAGVIVGLLLGVKYAGISDPNAIGFAPFQAGVTACCSATEIGSSWTVPRIGSARAGGEAQWVGTQTGNSFFVQIGTLETVPAAQFGARSQGRPSADYTAFWSDLGLGFTPQPLGRVLQPGDVVRARIHLVAGSWSATIVDVTQGWSDGVKVPSLGKAGLGEWLDEDLAATTFSLPTTVSDVTRMPTRTQFEFRDLTLNGARPTPLRLDGEGFVDESGEGFVGHFSRALDVVLVSPSAVRPR